MAFDSGIMTAVVNEISTFAKDAKVEKIQQPQGDEIVITLHSASRREKFRLVINAGANNPKIGFTFVQKENPIAAPMLCMLLRKQLGGGRFVGARQIGFDRVCELEFTCRDEMGFAVTRYIIVEIMGKYSNLILTDGDKKIITALHMVDFTTSRFRQILPGFSYELPPDNGKISIFELDFMVLQSKLEAIDSETPLHKFILNTFAGISPLVARELAHCATGETYAKVGGATADSVYKVITDFAERINSASFVPTLISDAEGKPVEFSFMPIKQYDLSFGVTVYESFGQLLDAYYIKRDTADRIRRQGQDIIKLISNATSRLEKKLDLQNSELGACADGEKYKLYGDLITANLYRIKRGDKDVALENYYSDDCEKVTIPLDKRLSPAQNAQFYYKKYNKCKHAKIFLSEQIAKAIEELRYLETVTSALDSAELQSDLGEIRRELSIAGYASRMKNYKTAKPAPIKPMEFETSSGYRLLCGKNNIQNDYVTFKVAEKSDIWFHVKNRPGSHAVLFCGGEEPLEEDYTEAAVIAATYSSAGKSADRIAVDYTRVKNVKKPPSAKPGFVTYSTNYTAYVTPDEKLCESLRKKK